MQHAIVAKTYVSKEHAPRDDPVTIVCKISTGTRDNHMMWTLFLRHA